MKKGFSLMVVVMIAAAAIFVGVKYKDKIEEKLNGLGVKKTEGNEQPKKKI